MTLWCGWVEKERKSSVKCFLSIAWLTFWISACPEKSLSTNLFVLCLCRFTGYHWRGRGGGGVQAKETPVLIQKTHMKMCLPGRLRRRRLTSTSTSTCQKKSKLALFRTRGNLSWLFCLNSWWHFGVYSPQYGVSAMAKLGGGELVLIPKHCQIVVHTFCGLEKKVQNWKADLATSLWTCNLICLINWLFFANFLVLNSQPICSKWPMRTWQTTRSLTVSGIKEKEFRRTNQIKSINQSINGTINQSIAGQNTTKDTTNKTL